MFNEVFDYLIEESVKSYVAKSEEEIIEQESADVATHVKKYRQSIIDGHGVIIVAHSQGNLFTNRAYNELGRYTANHDGWMKQYIKAIGIASPANNILGKSSPYMTFDNDMIQLVPDSLSPNVTNPKRYTFTNAVGDEIETLYSVEAHSFLSSYMATAVTRGAILGFIDDSVAVHKKAPSQWEKSAEIGCTCKDKAIFVKHKYDSTLDALMQDRYVLPFDEEGKLYATGFDYIKGSAEGESVLNDFNSEVCRTLLPTTQVIIGPLAVPQAKSGVVEVFLTWDKPAIDLDLEVKWDVGSVDIKDSGCPKEHFYVHNEGKIFPGRYSINVAITQYYIDYFSGVSNIHAADLSV